MAPISSRQPWLSTIMPYNISNAGDRNMATPSLLIERTGRRLFHQQQVNILSFFLPVGVATVIVCRTLLTAFSLPSLLVLVPLCLLGAFMIAALWRARKAADRTDVAALLDEKTSGQERFLTLETLPQTQQDAPFLGLVQRQAESKATSFKPARDVPFKLDRRVLLAWLASVLCILALFFIPLGPALSLFTPEPAPDEAVLTNLEEIARALMTQGKTTSKEQAIGAQLLA